MLTYRLLEAQSGRCLLPNVKCAEAPLDRFLGLMGRRGLEPGAGMHLPRCSSIHMFFMRFPIDVVYLDRDNRVKKIVASLKPWRVSWCPRARSVIEAPAGWAQEVGLERGAKVMFDPTAERLT